MLYNGCARCRLPDDEGISIHVEVFPDGDAGIEWHRSESQLPPHSDTKPGAWRWVTDMDSTQGHDEDKPSSTDTEVSADTQPIGEYATRLLGLAGVLFTGFLIVFRFTGESDAVNGSAILVAVILVLSVAVISLRAVLVWFLRPFVQMIKRG